MTKLRDALNRIFQKPDTPLAPDRVDYSYRVFWMKQARGWDAAQRRSVLAATRALAASADFEPNAFARHYRVEGVAGEHSGASLLALIQVLEAFDVAK
jgi:hypothetical protein